MTYSPSFNEGFLSTQLLLQVFSIYFTFIETNITLMRKEKINLIYDIIFITFPRIKISAHKSYLARWTDSSIHSANKKSRELEFRCYIFIIWFRKVIMLVAVKLLFPPSNIECILWKSCIQQIKEKIREWKYKSFFSQISLKMANLLHFS